MVEAFADRSFRAKSFNSKGNEMFKNVVIGVDGRQGGRDAVALAGRLAASAAHMTLVNVFGTGPLPGRGEALFLTGQTEEAVRILQREREHAGFDCDVVMVPDFSVGPGLHSVVERQHADLLVIGATRRGNVSRFLLGDDTDSNLTGAPSAVAIAPHEYLSGKEIRHIGVGYDGSPESQIGLAVARALAARLQASVGVLAVVPMTVRPYAEPIPENWDEKARKAVEAESHRLSKLSVLEGIAQQVVDGDPAERLQTWSKQLDLLIVGSRSQGPIGRLLSGSTARRLARSAACPLLVLPRSAELNPSIGDEDRAPAQV